MRCSYALLGLLALLPLPVLAQFGTPLELRNATPTIKDANPGEMPNPNAKLSDIYAHQPVFYRTTEAPGTIIIDTPRRFLYLIQGNNTAMRYGVGVGHARSISEIPFIAFTARMRPKPSGTRSPPAASDWSTRRSSTSTIVCRSEPR
jgi:lipoprotein-anchoring transpeptidase ErfK/SrfK